MKKYLYWFLISIPAWGPGCTEVHGSAAATASWVATMNAMRTQQTLMVLNMRRQQREAEERRKKEAKEKAQAELKKAEDGK